jgi:hypothetical protein
VTVLVELDPRLPLHAQTQTKTTIAVTKIKNPTTTLTTIMATCCTLGTLHVIELNVPGQSVKSIVLIQEDRSGHHPHSVKATHSEHDAIFSHAQVNIGALFVKVHVALFEKEMQDISVGHQPHPAVLEH